MIMRLIIILMALLAHVALYAEDNHNAIIHKHSAVFTMNSQTSGKLKVSTKMTIVNKHGLATAEFMVYNDEFRSLSSFSGTISVGDKVIKKLKKSDISTYSMTDGLASDASVAIFTPNAPYPFVVEYKYEVDYSRGMVDFPPFFPVLEPDVRLDESEYIIRLPEGTQMHYHSSEPPTVSKESRNDVYTWSFRDFNGYVSEHLMPSILSYVPYVYACPVEFSYGGKKGSQMSWKESGEWLYNLHKDTDHVPDELKSRILDVVSGLDDDKAKIKAIYTFLRENTRYVSIQLGIGGFRPFPVETVFKTGFGDCKALSSYMQALLGIVGIDSEYLIVNTSASDLIEGYSSVGQMNHAMLCVPVQNDTLWIECTNPRYPLGYRHSSIAGHQVVLIKENGGEVVRVPDYPDSLRLHAESIRVRLNHDGTATCTGTRHLMLDKVEPYISFESLDPKSQFASIMTGNNLNPDEFKITSIKDNFDWWLDNEGEYIPEKLISYTYHVADYGRVSGERMFIEVNPFSKNLHTERKPRVNPLVNYESYTYADTVCVVIPEGYVPESIPSSMQLDSRFGLFKSDVVYAPSTEKEQGSIKLVQTIRTIPFHAPAEEYASYRNFAKEVSKAYSAKIVLKKN